MHLFFVTFIFYHRRIKKLGAFLPVENNINNEIEIQEDIERIIVVLNNEKKTEENDESSNAENNTENINNEDANNETVNDNTSINDTTNSNVNSEPSGNNITANTPTYYIKVNYTENVVTIYTKDSDGNYTVPYKAMICSTGTSTPTSGVYPIKLKWEWLALFGDVYGQYTTQIVGNILFHSVPYLEKGNPASLEYWEYDKLGTSASMGCIRLKVEDAMWIYNNCPSGTMVEFYSSSDAGPLGKPDALKISEYDSPYRDWDPTDPNASNPWNTNPPQE